jgi:hypothetical protein
LMATMIFMRWYPPLPQESHKILIIKLVNPGLWYILCPKSKARRGAGLGLLLVLFYQSPTSVDQRVISSLRGTLRALPALLQMRIPCLQSDGLIQPRILAPRATGIVILCGKPQGDGIVECVLNPLALFTRHDRSPVAPKATIEQGTLQSSR